MRTVRSGGGDPVYPKEITAQSLADYLTRTRSLPGSPYDFRAAADTIAAHESAFTMDPKLKQYGGGPGRGVYQFEPAAAETASNRLRQLADIFGVENPDWNRGVSDVSKLSREQQDMLFFADKIMAPDADSRALAEGRIPSVLGRRSLPWPQERRADDGVRSHTEGAPRKRVRRRGACRGKNQSTESRRSPSRPGRSHRTIYERQK